VLTLLALLVQKIQILTLRQRQYLYFSGGWRRASAVRPAQQTDQFTCFTGTKVQILTLASIRSAYVKLRPAQQKDQFTCFMGTKVQILTLASIRSAYVELRPAQQKDQFTCFTGTKVQILTLASIRSAYVELRPAQQKELDAALAAAAGGAPTLLALLVQKYKY
jgi:hypothetical protein